MQPPTSSWLANVLERGQALKAQLQALALNEAWARTGVPRVLLCLGLACMSTGAMWWGYVGELKRLSQSEQRLEVSLRSEFEQKLWKAISRDGLQKQRTQVQRDVQQLERLLPNKSEMAALLSEISQAGVARHLQFEQFRPGVEVVKTHYVELPIGLRVSGSFHDLGMFLADIAHLPRIVTVQQISLEPKGSSGVLLLEATILTYRYLDAADASAPSSRQVSSQEGQT